MRWLRIVASFVATVGLLTGCSIGLQDLPGPAGTSGPTYPISAAFRDVENLTLGAKVKLGGVVVGEVTDITTSDFLAHVHMDIEKAFRLGDGARFQIRFTTPLGEDFVSVTDADDGAPLADGASVPVRQTDAAPDIEDTFAAVSTLLNGGGLSNLKTIATELDTAFHGRTGDARDALIRLQTITANLDEHKDDLDQILYSFGRLADTLNKSTPVIENALEMFPPTLRSLADDTAGARALLQRVDRLGSTVRNLLARGQRAMLADFDNLRPTLDSLRARSDELIPTFRTLIELGQKLRAAAPGDYFVAKGVITFLQAAPGAKPPPHGTVHPGSEAPRDAAFVRLLSGGLR
jgi:phospholipid/cholesterol/gamma-HCH transport system substrate-binding protein